MSSIRISRQTNEFHPVKVGAAGSNGKTGEMRRMANGSREGRRRVRERDDVFKSLFPSLIQTGKQQLIKNPCGADCFKSSRSECGWQASMLYYHYENRT